MHINPNYSENLKDAIRIGQSYVKEFQNEKFAPAHMLKALMHKNAGIQPFLKSLGKDLNYIAEWSEVRIEDYPKSIKISEVAFADDKLASVFEEAENIRFKLSLDLTDCICVLCALIKPGFGFSVDQLKSLPLKEKEIIESLLGNSNIENTLKTSVNNLTQPTTMNGSLLSYCIDKNDRFKQGKTDPVVGRDKEILMMVEILGRRSKPNVLLIGDPGVGKSALIDGLVQKIISQQVPEQLKPAIIFELELGALFAGASYKGEIEDRLKNIIKDLQNYDKAILFIDEIHTILDNKGQGGSTISNLLKPELARGELTIIGATTQEEFRKIIEPDSAINRRFEAVIVSEPSLITASKMVSSVIHKYERHHSIKAEKDTIIESVNLAKRYIKDKKLPDSAIDLLDRTMAAIKMMNETSFGEINKVQDGIDLVFNNKEFSDLDKESELKWLYYQLINSISPVLTGHLENESVIELLSGAEKIYEEINNTIDKLKGILQNVRSTVSKQDLSAIIAFKTGIPIGKIQTQERDKLLNIEQQLKKRVIGQNHAVKILSDTILESRSGINKQGQPIGSFFFLGPTGTGKTELTKALAEFLFNEEKAMIRFDMSEFKEEHSAALLYGAPPGYVGYEEGGMLVNKIRKQPYSVVLFDEIEKAHPSVFDTFLQIMDEGTLHDKLGKEGDFSNALIIFTSNIGSEWVSSQFQNGNIPNSSQLMEVMAKNFRPEFLARISEIIPFAPISENNVVRILEIQLKSLLESLNKQEIHLNISPEAKKELALSGFTPKYGARQLSSVIRTRLRRPIARMIVTGELVKGDELRIGKELEGEELNWKIIRNGEIISTNKKEYNTIEI